MKNTKSSELDGQHFYSKSDQIAYQNILLILIDWYNHFNSRSAQYNGFAGFSRFWGESSRPSRGSTLCSQLSSESAPDYCPTSHPVNCTSKGKASILSFAKCLKQQVECRNPLPPPPLQFVVSHLQFNPEANVPGGWDGRTGVSRVPASGSMGVVGWGYRGQAALPWHWNCADQGAHLWWVQALSLKLGETSPSIAKKSVLQDELD